MKRSLKSDRIKACELAALVLCGREIETYAPTVWSLTVFFESYIEAGATGTLRDFGPKKPVKLKAVR
jgi:hypothetical protein